MRGTGGWSVPRVPRIALAVFVFATASVVLAPARSDAEGEKEYSLSAGTECVYSPGGLNGTGPPGGAVALQAKGPESVVPTQETKLTATTAVITLPRGLTEFILALGGQKVSGKVTNLLLDFERLEPPSVNAATPEGSPGGLTYTALVESGKETKLNLPESGSSQLGPLTVSGSAGQNAVIKLDTSPAYTERGPQQGYRATGEGVVLELSAYYASGGHVLGPIPVVCTAHAASTEMHIVAPPNGSEAPVNTSLPEITPNSGAPKEGQTLTASEGGWRGTETISKSFRWQRCSAPESCHNIELATARTYTPQHEDIGDTIRALVSATNVAGTTRKASLETGKVEKFPPHNTTLPAISGEPRQGKLLNANAGSWEGATPIHESFQWESCTKEACNPIERATSSAYAPTSGDVGRELRVTVTAKNVSGEAKATSEKTEAVAPLAPGEKEYVVTPNTKCLTAPGVLNEHGEGSVSVAAIGPENVQSGHELNLTAATTTIKLPANLATWLTKLGASQVRGKLKNLLLDFTGLEAPSLNIGTSEGLSQGRPYSASVQAEQEIAVYIPESGTFQIGPEKVTGAVEETVGASVDQSAAFQEPPEVEHYRATGNGIVVELSGYSSSGGHVIGPIQVDCTAGSSSTSLPIVGPPSNTALPTISGTAEDEQTLTAVPGTWKGTKPISYSYEWQRCAGSSCQAIGGATHETYALSHEDVGRTIRAVVTATNGYGGSSATSQATIAVVGAPPRNTVPPAISGTPEEGQTLTTTTGAWAGTPQFSYSYQWERCNPQGEACEAIEGETGESYQPSSEDSGDTIRVVVTASNSVGSTPAGWRSPATLATGNIYAPEPPAVAADPTTNEVTAVWSQGHLHNVVEYENPQSSVSTSTYAEGQWSSPTTLFTVANPALESIGRTRIATSPAGGSVSAVWDVESGPERAHGQREWLTVWVDTRTGGQWGQPVQLNAGGPSEASVGLRWKNGYTAPAVIYNTLGEPTVLWVGQNEVAHCKQSQFSSCFPSYIYTGQPSQMCLGHHEQGGEVEWASCSYWTIEARTLSAGSWSAPAEFGSIGGWTAFTTVANSSGAITAAWQVKDPSTGRVVPAAATLSGGTWSAAAELETGEHFGVTCEGANGPLLAQDGPWGEVAQWSANCANNTAIIATSMLTAGVWSAPHAVASQPGERFSYDTLTPFSEGVLSTWSNESNGTDYAVLSAGEWSAPASTDLPSGESRVDLFADTGIAESSGNVSIPAFGERGMLGTTFDGMTWTAPSALGGERASRFNIRETGLSPAGNAVLVWNGEPEFELPDLHASEHTEGGGWTQTLDLPPPSEGEVPSQEHGEPVNDATGDLFIPVARCSQNTANERTCRPAVVEDAAFQGGLVRRAESPVTASVKSLKECSTRPAELGPHGEVIPEAPHCYARARSPVVSAPGGFQGSSVRIVPKCMAATNGALQQEQWVIFKREPEGEWLEGGAHVGSGQEEGAGEYFAENPEFFWASAETQPGDHKIVHEHEAGHHGVPLNRYFEDTIWRVRGSKWEAFEGAIGAPSVHGEFQVNAGRAFGQQLYAGIEDAGEFNKARGSLEDLQYETLNKGKWRQGWSAAGARAQREVRGPHGSFSFTNTGRTTAAFAFESC
jgi:hypothetical protein